jgi:hypothetical protein
MVLQPKIDVIFSARPGGGRLRPEMLSPTHAEFRGKTDQGAKFLWAIGGSTSEVIQSPLKISHGEGRVAHAEAPRNAVQRPRQLRA